jgi:hypothetical protein
MIAIIVCGSIFNLVLLSFLKSHAHPDCPNCHGEGYMLTPGRFDEGDPVEPCELCQPRVVVQPIPMGQEWPATGDQARIRKPDNLPSG